MRLSTVRLGSVAEVEREGVDPQTIQPGTTYVGLEHISGEGRFTELPRVQPGDLGSTKFAFSERHVLFGKLRPYLRKIARPTFSGICSTDIIPISPSSKIDRNYLFHYLRTDAVIDRATSMASGANLPRINPRHLIDFEVPLPPLDEQRRIAAILDQADALRRKQRDALEKLRDVPHATFAAMFGDPSKNPYGFPSVSLGEVTSKISDGPHVSPSYVEHGVPFLSTRNIKRGYVDWSDLKHISLEDAHTQWKKIKPELGDVLYTKGGTTGIAKAVDFDGDFAVWVHVAVLKLRADLVDPTWLEGVLNSKHCYRQSQALTKGIVNRDLGLKRMATISFPLPPLELQNQFALFMEHLKYTRESAESRLSQLNGLFASLQHRAFRGEL